MGNRMLRDSLLESEKISNLSDFDFRLWVVLILLADDYGVTDARPEIIKGRGYPLRSRVTVKDISDSLQRLAAVGCVSLYTVGGKPYAQFPKWGEHQRLRNSKHKYPTIDEAEQGCRDLRQVAASRGESRPELELELEGEGEGEGEGKRANARTRPRFTPPTVDEVSTYATERGYNISADRFVDYYTANGWRVGKNPMKDWRAAVRSWAARDQGESKPAQKNPALNYSQRDSKGRANGFSKVYNCETGEWEDIP